jgi:Sodium/hydrogen exchanger family
MLVKGLDEHEVKGPAAQLILAIMVVEDLLSVLLLAIVTGIASGTGMVARELAVLIAQMAAFLATMIAIGILVVPRTIRLVVRLGRGDLLLITSLAICFAMVWVAARAEYSIALGAFLAGTLIAESGKASGVLLAAAIQTFLPFGALIVVAALAVLVLATRRSIANFHSHVRAGSELIVEILGRQGVDPNAPPPTLHEVEAALPGFGGLTAVAVPEGATAVGQSSPTWICAPGPAPRYSRSRAAAKARPTRRRASPCKPGTSLRSPARETRSRRHATF